MTEESLFLAALDHKDPDARRRFLDDACADNPELRKRLDVLLAAFAAGKEKLEPPPVDPDATGFHVPRADVGAVLVGRYKLLERIGEGGMGEVWVAEQVRPVQRKVALKLIKPGMDSKGVLARFEAERQALAMMDHPNIARVFDGGTLDDQGRPFFVMELVKGIPITEYCDAHRLGPRERLELFIPVCQAVQHAHQKGVIHRDLKPTNVLVAPYDGRPVPKVIDFGIAKAAGARLTDLTLHTAFGAVIGTPEYMAPEQAELNNLDVDTRADIYSLGVLLYELLAGSPPFDVRSLAAAGLLEAFRVIREQEPPKPSTRASTSAALPTIAANRGLEPKKLTGLLRGELDWIVMKALEKDRNRRYETANSFAMDVQRYLAGEPVVAVPPSAGYRVRKFVRRNRGRVIASLLVLLVLIAGVIGTTAGLVAARGQRDAAREAREQSDADREAAVVEFRRAEGEAGRARLARQEAEAALARSDALRLGSEAVIARPTDPGLALLLGLESVHRYPHHLTYRALYEAASDLRERRALRTGTSRLGGARFRPDRALLYSTDISSGKAAVIDLPTGKQLGVRAGVPAGLVDVDWSPDGTRAVGVPVGRVTVGFTDGQKPHQATFTERVAVVWDTATGRDLVHLRRHDDRVVSARFSPDGTRILTGSWDGTARVWDANSGKELVVIRGHTDSLQSALFSPDGKRILTLGVGDRMTAFGRGPDAAPVPADPERAEDPGITVRPYRFESGSTGSSHFGGRTMEGGAARLWEADTGKPAGALSLPTGAGWKALDPQPVPLVAAFSSDGRRAAIGFSHGFAAVWGLTGGAAPQVLIESTLGFVSAVAFSPAADRLAVSGDGGAVIVWDVQAGRREHLLAGHQGAVNTLAFSDFGRRLVTGGTDRSARVWEVRTGKELAVLRGHSGRVVAAHFLDPDTIVTAGDDTLRTWSLATSPPVAIPLSEPDPPGGRLGKLLGKTPARHNDDVSAMVFAPDGKSIVTGSGDRTVRRWDAVTGRPLAQLMEELRGEVSGLQFGPGGVVYAAVEGTFHWNESVTDPATHLSQVHRWNPATGRATRILKDQNAAVTDLELSPDGRRLLIVRGPGELHYLPEARSPFNVEFRQVAGPWAPVSVWDTTTGERLWSGPAGDQSEDWPRPRFSPDGRLVVYRTEKVDELALYDAGTGARVRVLQSDAEGRMMSSVGAARWDEVLFSPDGQVIVGQAHGVPELWFWNASTGAVLGSFRVSDPNFLLQPRMAFTPDSRRLAVSVDRAVHVIDVATRTEVAVLRGHEARVLALAVSPDGTRLLTGSEDKTAALWDMATGRLVSVYRGHAGGVNLVAYSPDGTRVATASAAEHLARVWPVDLVPVFEQRKPRELTAAERARYELPGGRE